MLLFAGDSTSTHNIRGRTNRTMKARDLMIVAEDAPQSSNFRNAIEVL